MLVLTRRQDEEIVIGDNIRITVLSVDGTRVRLGFAAPADVTILRGELDARDKLMLSHRRESELPPLPSGPDAQPALLIE